MTRKGWSLYTQTLLLGLVPALILSFILATYFISARIKDASHELDNKGQLVALQLAASSDYFVLTSNEAIVKPLTKALLDDRDVEYIEIEDINGNLLFSQHDHTSPDAQTARGQLRWYQADIVQYNILMDDEDWFNSQQNQNQQILGQVRIGLSESSVFERQKDILLHALFIALVALFIVGLVGWLSAQRLARPIHLLSNAVKQMREGDYKIRVGVTSSAEVGQLQEGVNTLASALARSEEIQQLYVDSLIKAREASEAANKAKSEFLTVMTHELRTPMNGVLGMLQLLQTTTLNTEQSEYVDTALNSGDHLLGLINDILDFSKIEQGKIELDKHYFNVYDSLLRVVETFRSAVSAKGLEFNVDINEIRGLDVMTDDIRLNQVLVNLVGNAVKFTEKGFIRISVREVHINTEQVDFIIDVSDSGKGISADNISRIFDAFQQEDASISRRYGGTGLGLAISRQLIERMGGKLTVNSTVNKGSVFSCHLTLPCRVQEGMQPLLADKTLQDMQKFSARVLLVEDNDVNQKVAIRMMNYMGLTVDVASDGIQAIKMANQFAYDIIFMDLQMPRMDGYEAAKRIRTQENINNKTPIVALTANAFFDVKEQCLQVGMNDFLAKPYKKSSLINILNRWLNNPA